MKKPYVALVGRPNTGKSTLFNRLAGRRISIVHDMPGVTRDRIITEASWQNRDFYLIDTGGIEPENKDEMLSQMRRQAQIAMDMADVIVLIADGREGVHPADADIAQTIRTSGKRCVLAVNKLDDVSMHSRSYEFYELALGEPVVLSAERGAGVGDLLDAITSQFHDLDDSRDEETAKIAVVGRPNVGKSTLVNRLCGEERVIVSEIAGTTRDAIDTMFTHDGKSYTIIDTAGMKRKNKQYGDIDYYASVRAAGAIERSDVCLMMIDAAAGVTEQDTKIAGSILDAGKAMVILVNKWDLVEKETNTMARMTEDIRKALYFVDYAPILFLSAIDGKRISKLMPAVNAVLAEYSKRVNTGLVNEVISNAVMMNPTPTRGGRHLNILYASQVSVKPPSFVLFVNDSSLVNKPYERYITNKLREAFSFQGSPIRIFWRNREED